MSTDQPPPEEPASIDTAAARPAESPSLFERFRSLFNGRGTMSLRESLADVLDEDPRALSDALSAKERSMLRNVLGLRDLRVEDVMVPRADIDAVEIDATVGSLLKEFREAGHSRLPVYRETLDDPAGMVHIKDLMGHITAEAMMSEAELAERVDALPCGLDFGKVQLQTPLRRAGLVREVLYVPPSMPAGELLVKMQATRIHLAIVVDEYGGTDGLVSIEDLVEEIVGDIEDEHDEESLPKIVPTADGGFVADARAPIEEVAAILGDTLELGDLVEDIDTLGGLVFNRVGHVPVRGELVSFPGGYEFEILDADARRVKRVKIHRRTPGTRPVKRERPADRSDAA